MMTRGHFRIYLRYYKYTSSTKVKINHAFHIRTLSINAQCRSMDIDGEELIGYDRYWSALGSMLQFWLALTAIDWHWAMIQGGLWYKSDSKYLYYNFWTSWTLIEIHWWDIFHDLLTSIGKKLFAHSWVKIIYTLFDHCIIYGYIYVHVCSVLCRHL